jgi:16S rRNA (cytosine967-C5)-methyltransferase
MMKYDVIIIGAGPGGIFSAYELMKLKPELKLAADPSDYDGLIEIQKRILTNALRYTKPGGMLEYSTCTLNKKENEELVKQVLSKEGTSARIIEMTTLMPYNGKVGFYYCIIEKNAI